MDDLHFNYIFKLKKILCEGSHFFKLMKFNQKTICFWNIQKIEFKKKIQWSKMKK
jgi:hypothetical protein